MDSPEIKDTKKHKILIVDDDMTLLEGLALAIESWGYKPFTAEKADKALLAFQENDFSLVLLDIRMPGYDGVWLLERIKQIDENKPVIMISSAGDFETVIECLRKGANNYIRKPINLAELEFFIKQAIEKYELYLENLYYQLNLKNKVLEQTEIIRNLFLQAIKVAINSLEAKDKYTQGHSQRVAKLARSLAKTIGMDDEMLDKVELAGLLHDVGKIGISENILQKPSNLSEDEFKRIKEHPTIGLKILSPVIKDEWILDGVLHHHERWDGCGYPDGISGESLSLIARILSIIDAYDALTTDRPYRKAYSSNEALSIIKKNGGTQFDPALVEIFLNLLKKIS